jgi:hypothetical protein
VVKVKPADSRGKSMSDRGFGRRRNVSPKRRLTQDLHSATSQKMTFSIVTAVNTSNLTSVYKYTPVYTSSVRKFQYTRWFHS